MRLLVVGTGGMANSHAQAFAQIEGVEMVGAVDVDPKRAKGFAEKHG
ncbi:oxidoreductase, partial [Ensifer sp. NM-2]